MFVKQIRYHTVLCPQFLEFSDAIEAWICVGAALLSLLINFILFLLVYVEGFIFNCVVDAIYIYKKYEYYSNLAETVCRLPEVANAI